MSAIKSIRTRHIQSHEDVFIELPETGLVVFSGDNSNGKSVIRKVLSDVITYSINNVRVRKSDISRDSNEGSLEIKKYDGSSLFVNLNMEASQTWVRLTRANGEEVTRYLSDKTIPDLVREFGFHYDANRGISLNICDSDDSILFFRTPHVANYDVISSALTDSDAQMKYEVLREQYQQSIILKQSFQENARVASAARSALVMYDEEKEEALMEKLYRCANVMQHTYVPKLSSIKPVPHVKFIELPEVRLKNIKTPRFVALPSIKLRDMLKSQSEVDSLLKGECPTCHRAYCSCQTYTSET